MVTIIRGESRGVARCTYFVVTIRLITVHPFCVLQYIIVFIFHTQAFILWRSTTKTNQYAFARTKTCKFMHISRFFSSFPILCFRYVYFVYIFGRLVDGNSANGSSHLCLHTLWLAKGKENCEKRRKAGTECPSKIESRTLVKSCFLISCLKIKMSCLSIPLQW